MRDSGSWSPVTWIVIIWVSGFVLGISSAYQAPTSADAIGKKMPRGKFTVYRGECFLKEEKH